MFSQPLPPTGLAVTSVTQTQINLSWNTVSRATNYTVYQDGSSIQTITTNTYSAGVSCGTTHSYYVKAGNYGGTSGASNTVNGTASACTYTLTVNSSGNGVGTGSGTVTSGVPQPITASANTGYHFVNWMVTSGTASIGNANSANTSVTLTSGGATVTANFAINTYTLTYTAGANGSISGLSPQTVIYNGNAISSVTAVPNTGYHFVSWSDGLTIDKVNCRWNCQ